MRPITKIDIITRTEKLDELKVAFAEIGVTGMTVSQVFGCGLQKGHKEVYRGQAYDINLVPKVKIETVVCEVPVDEVLRVASLKPVSPATAKSSSTRWPMQLKSAPANRARQLLSTTINERRLVPGDRYGNKRNVKAVQILRLNKERNLRSLTSPNISLWRSLDF